MPEFPAIQHVAVTVSDLERGVPWYRTLFGTDPVIDEDTGRFRHVVWLLGGTLLGLHQFHADDAGADVDEHRLGLDHIALGRANRAELERWQAHLQSIGVQHGGIVDAPSGSGLASRGPDNLPLEFFAPPG